MPDGFLHERIGPREVHEQPYDKVAKVEPLSEGAEGVFGVWLT